jgi:hypothetical protein
MPSEVLDMTLVLKRALKKLPKLLAPKNFLVFPRTDAWLECSSGECWKAYEVSLTLLHNEKTGAYRSVPKPDDFPNRR